MEVHIVQKGDTLWKIARQYGVSFEELKRVNAHLANPDYIVPGMKIMLPKKQGDKGKHQMPTKGESGGNKKHVEPVKKPPTNKPSHQEQVKPPKPPVKLPQMPNVPPASSLPPVPPAPPVQPAPPVHASQPPMHMQHMNHFQIIGIPCGWMPIYDADCHPHMHHMPMPPMQQMPQMPPQQLPTYEEPAAPGPGPLPFPTPQLPVIDKEYDESPQFPGHGPIPMPDDDDSLENWQPMEPPVQMPQNQWGPIQQGFPSNTQSMPCGCGSQYPPAPINHCHSCHQPMPNHMMPMQGHNRYGYY